MHAAKSRFAPFRETKAPAHPSDRSTLIQTVNDPRNSSSTTSLFPTLSFLHPQKLHPRILVVAEIINDYIFLRALRAVRRARTSHYCKPEIIARIYGKKREGKREIGRKNSGVINDRAYILQAELCRQPNCEYYGHGLQAIVQTIIEWQHV